MAKTKELLKRENFGDTERKDNWWLHPLSIFVGLSIFIVYATFRTFYPVFYPENPGMTSGPMLSPFFAPLIFGGEHAWFGEFPAGWPRWLRSPAILILWAPLGFRLTCYYARKAYYRGFFSDPAACAVSEGQEEYTGERGLWIFQNLHRYFFYLAVIFMFILWYDAVKATFGWDHWSTFKITGGTIVLTLDALLITGYTLGCHSFRYLVGGGKRCFSCPHSDGEISSRYSLWKWVSTLNLHHHTYFWLSLFMVGFTDLYIWMVATDTWPDITIIGG